MSGIPITFACGLYDRMLALYTGDVKPHGIDLNFLAIDHPREIFDRMLINLEFEACEMSSSEFIRHAVRPDCPLVAIPVFPSRVFRHGYIAIDKRQVREPKDLAGKRIGVPLYAMTAAIFDRDLAGERDAGWCAVPLGVADAAFDPGHAGKIDAVIVLEQAADEDRGCHSIERHADALAREVLGLAHLALVDRDIAVPEHARGKHRDCH